MNATKAFRFTYFAGMAMAMFGAFSLAPAPALADDPAFLSVGGGTYDWNRQKDEGMEFRM